MAVFTFFLLVVVPFRNLFPVLRKPKLFKDLIDVLIEDIRAKCPDVDVIVGLDSRGFLFGPMIAQALNIAFVPVRKKGKLPGETVQVEYTLEYGKVSINMFIAIEITCDTLQTSLRHEQCLRRIYRSHHIVGWSVPMFVDLQHSSIKK